MSGIRLVNTVNTEMPTSGTWGWGVEWSKEDTVIVIVDRKLWPRLVDYALEHPFELGDNDRIDVLALRLARGLQERIVESSDPASQALSVRRDEQEVFHKICNVGLAHLTMAVRRLGVPQRILVDALVKLRIDLDTAFWERDQTPPEYRTH